MDSFSRIFQTALQLAIVGLVWAVSEAVVRFTHLPVSSGVLGLFLMLALLGSGVIKVGMVERGAKWVLGELVFFFIPIMVSVLQYRDLLMSEGWQLVLTIAVGTALVMISDTIARTLFSPVEIPVGIMMAVLGVPFFLFLLRRAL